MKTDKLNETTPDRQMTEMERTIHECQAVIDKLGTDAEWLITLDNYLGAKTLLDNAWELQRATYDKSPVQFTGPRASLIRDTLLDIGFKLNQTPNATATRERVFAEIDAEVLAGTRTLRDAEGYKRSAYSMPYGQAARPKDHDYNPYSVYDLPSDVKAALTKMADADMRTARKEGEFFLCQTRYGTTILRYEANRTYGYPGHYVLVKAGTPTSPAVIIDQGQAKHMRATLMEVYDVQVEDASPQEKLNEMVNGFTSPDGGLVR